MRLVQNGRAHDVLDDIDAVDAGIHAWRAKTRQLAMELIAAGYNGLLAPGYAPASTKGDRNLILRPAWLAPFGRQRRTCAGATAGRKNAAAQIEMLPSAG